MRALFAPKSNLEIAPRVGYGWTAVSAVVQGRAATVQHRLWMSSECPRTVCVHQARSVRQGASLIVWQRG
jgi:hypothetical protein